MTTLAAPIFNNFTACSSRHAGTKAMFLGSFANIWLIRALHLISSIGLRGAVPARGPKGLYVLSK